MFDENMREEEYKIYEPAIKAAKEKAT